MKLSQTKVMNALVPREQSLRCSILFAGIFHQLCKVTRERGRREIGRLQRQGKILKRFVAPDFYAISCIFCRERILKKTIACMTRCLIHNKDEGQHVACPFRVDHHRNSMA